MDDWRDNSYIRHVRATHPSCLIGFRCASQNQDVEWNGWAEWRLACQCGGQIGKLIGYPLREYRKDYTGHCFVGPLTFKCESCGREIEVFDPQEHGYNAEVDRMEGIGGLASIRGTGERRPFVCSKCGDRSFEISTQFSHSNFDIIQDEPKLEPRSQDFFDWFICAGICACCGEKVQISEYECA